MWRSNQQPLCSLERKNQLVCYSFVVFITAKMVTDILQTTLSASPSLVVGIHDAKPKFQHSVTNKYQAEREKVQSYLHLASEVLFPVTRG